MAYSKDIRIGRKRKILVISDVHVPYHDSMAVAKALEKGAQAGVDTCIILGDLLDFHKVSRYRKDRDALEIEDELGMAKDLLRLMVMDYKWDYYFIPGNHEDRLGAYIADNAPALGGLPGLELGELLELKSMGITYVPGGFIHCGDISFLHGHELHGLGGLDPARKLFNKMKRSAICGHLHRPDSFYTRDGAGNLLQTHVVGHLGHKYPEFMPRNDWQHGCAIVEVPKSGNTKVTNHIL